METFIWQIFKALAYNADTFSVALFLGLLIFVVWSSWIREKRLLEYVKSHKEMDACLHSRVPEILNTFQRLERDVERQIRSEMQSVQSELRAEMREMISEFKAEVRQDISELRRHLIDLISAEKTHFHSCE